MDSELDVPSSTEKRMEVQQHLVDMLWPEVTAHLNEELALHIFPQGPLAALQGRHHGGGTNHLPIKRIPQGCVLLV